MIEHQLTSLDMSDISSARNYVTELDRLANEGWEIVAINMAILPSSAMIAYITSARRTLDISAWSTEFASDDANKKIEEWENEGGNGNVS